MKRLMAMLFASLALVLGAGATAASAQTGQAVDADDTRTPVGTGGCTANEDVAPTGGDGFCTSEDYEILLGTTYTAVEGVVITPPAPPAPPAPPVPVAPPTPPRLEVLGTTETRGNLVRTGLEAMPFAAAGAALIGAGAVLVVGARKRRDAVLPAS